jgi:Bacterial SH3 domain
MHRTHVMIGLASLLGAALAAGPALAVTASSPTGHLNVRSGPGFQYQVVSQIPANTPAQITGCVSDYSWCAVAPSGRGDRLGFGSLSCDQRCWHAEESPSCWCSARHSGGDAGQHRGASRGDAAGRRHGAGCANRWRCPAGRSTPDGPVLHDAAGDPTGSSQRRGDGRSSVASGRARLSHSAIALPLFLRQRATSSG